MTRLRNVCHCCLSSAITFGLLLCAAPASARTLIYERSPAGTVRHAIGSALSGTYATLELARTTDTWASADTVTVRGDGDYGQEIECGTNGLATIADLDLTFAGDPVLIGTIATSNTGVVNVWNVSGVQMLGRVYIRVRGTSGSALSVKATSADVNDLLIENMECLAVAATTSRHAYRFEQSASFRVHRYNCKLKLHQGTGYDDIISFAGTSPTVPGAGRFVDCDLYGATAATNSNFVGLDTATYARFEHCTMVNSGGPGFVSGNYAGSFGSVGDLYECTVDKTHRNQTAAFDLFAVFARHIVRCRITDALGGVAISNSTVNDGVGSLVDSLVRRDASLLTAVSGNVLGNRAVRVRVKRCDISGNRIEGFRYVQDGTYDCRGIDCGTNMAGFDLSITDNTFIDTARAIFISGTDGKVRIMRNTFDGETFSVGTAATAVLNQIDLNGATSNGLDLTLWENTVRLVPSASGSTVRYTIRTTANTEIVSAGNNKLWNSDTAADYSGYVLQTGDVSTAGAATEPDFSSSGLPDADSPDYLLAHGGGAYLSPDANTADTLDANIVAINGGDVAQALRTALLQSGSAMRLLTNDNGEIAIYDINSNANSDLTGALFSSGQQLTTQGGRIESVDNVGGVVRGDPEIADPIAGVGVRADERNGAAIATAANQTTTLARFGNFPGTGTGTLFDYQRALMRKDLPAPDGLGGTFSPSSDSVEAISDMNTSGGASAAAVWAYATRSLTQPTAQIVAALTGTSMTLQRGDTITLSWTGLGSLANRTEMWFAAKQDVRHTDAQSAIMVTEAGGCTVLAGAAPGVGQTATITVTDAAAGNVTVSISAAAAARLPLFSAGAYDLQVKRSTGAVNTLSTGPARVVADVTQSTGG